MKTNGNTILITGGGSGIGFEIAKVFSENNHVILTGRTDKKLLEAASQLQNVTTVTMDVTDEKDIEQLAEYLASTFPKLNVLINNAGIAYAYDMTVPGIDAHQKAFEEINTNYLAVVRLTEKLLPLLGNQQEAAIVNVSSVGAFVPGKILSTYSASKAALHSYTQTLRLSLANSGIRVFELMPPLVNTEFSKEIGGEHGIHPQVVAQELMNAFIDDNFEIHVGQTADLYKLHLSSPSDALAVMNNFLNS